MKRFLTFALACFPLMCIGAPSISYTTYFNNTHTYTNSTTAGTNSASRGVFTNSLSAAGFNTSGTTNATLTGNLLANGGVFTNGITLGASGNLFGGANLVEQRNGTTAQEFRVYATYTDASNHRHVRIGDGYINYGGLGTGISGAATYTIANLIGTGASDLILRSSSSSGSVRFTTGATERWNINSSGHFLASTDNTYDIGASGATRPRTIYAAAGVNAGSGSTSVFQNGKIIALQFTGGSYGGSQTVGLFSPSDGVLQMYDAAGTSFNRIQFGGTSASFPALKRSTTNLVVRLADDSANTGLEANVLISRLNATSAAAPTIASATTIAPTNSIVFISGTDAIETITAPAPISATGGQITLIPTGIFTTTTAGNIALASTAVVSKALIMTYDSGSTKWYPSY